MATTVCVDGEDKDRDIYDIAVEVGEKALGEWGKQEGEIYYAKRAPKARYDLWKKLDIIPRGIDREIVEIMHRTHMGVDQDYENLMKQGSRAALADGWAGSMMATDMQDVLVRHPLSGSWGNQPGGLKARPSQYHRPWSRTPSFRNDRCRRPETRK